MHAYPARQSCRGAMSKFDHIGFVSSASAFSREASDAVRLTDLQACFEDALRRESITAYDCAEGLGGSPNLSGGYLAGGCDSVHGHACHVRIPVAAPDGSSIPVDLFAQDWPDGDALARLHLLAVLYITHAIILQEADCAPAVGGHCVALAARGLSYYDIGERIGVSPQAVAIHIRRAFQPSGSVITH